MRKKLNILQSENCFDHLNPKRLPPSGTAHLPWSLQGICNVPSFRKFQVSNERPFNLHLIFRIPLEGLKRPSIRTKNERSQRNP